MKMWNKYCRHGLSGDAFFQRFLDESLAAVMFSVGVAILAGACIMMALSSCSKKNGGEDSEARLMAVKSLRLTAESPESLRIVAFSDMDSVFGKNFFSDNELTMILKNISDFSSHAFGAGMDDFDIDDPGLSEKIRRGMAVNDVIQNTVNSVSGDNDFTGWKMKVLYEYRNRFNDTVRNEKYFIFDTDKKFIIHSFDIPIL